MTGQTKKLLFLAAAGYLAWKFVPLIFIPKPSQSNQSSGTITGNYQPGQFVAGVVDSSSNEFVRKIKDMLNGETRTYYGAPYPGAPEGIS